MTSRLLLTLLALLTGLSAHSAPAEARVHAERAAEMCADSGQVGEVREDPVALLALLPAACGRALKKGNAEAPRGIGFVAAPAVFTGIDRARE